MFLSGSTSLWSGDFSAAGHSSPSYVPAALRSEQEDRLAQGIFENIQVELISLE